MKEADQPLFSYGTLQYAEVQRAQFGRLLDSSDDALAGFRMGRVVISDPEVVRKSGEARHPALVASGDPVPHIQGKLFWITTQELESADEYESGEYARQRVTLVSGHEAWVFVARPGLEVE